MITSSTPSVERSLVGLRPLQHRVHRPGDPGYDPARAAWNRNAVHQPALVVTAESAADVQAAVRFAADAGLGVGVMATGHGTGRGCDGGLLVTTSGMRQVSVDPAARTARVDAGALWDDLVPLAAAHGLTGLPGSSHGVGVVGYTLGGGFGWLGRRFGLAAHAVLGAEVVTADGELVTAGPSSHPDLLWGLAGGAGTLGVVTSLEIALQPLTQVYAGNLYYPLDRARDVLAFFAAWSRSVPPELTAAATFRSFPPLPTVPEALRGRSLVALRGCFCGDLTEGRTLIDQARAALGPAAVDTFGRLPIPGLPSISMDPTEPLPATNHTELVADLTPEAIDDLVALAGPGSGSPLVMVELRLLGGALAGPPGALHPMAHTRAGFSLNAVGVTPTPEHAARVRDHLARLATAMRPHVTGETYLNFLDLEAATPERVRAAYTPDDWARMVALKQHYDPRNLFRFTRPIGPA